MPGLCWPKTMGSLVTVDTPARLSNAAQRDGSFGCTTCRNFCCTACRNVVSPKLSHMINGVVLPYIADGITAGEPQIRGWLWRMKRLSEDQELVGLSGIPASFGQWTAFGWLEPGHEYTAGLSPGTFVQALEMAALAPVFVTRGFHMCQYCSASPENFGPTAYETRDGGQLQLGSACLKVTDRQQRVWLAPNLVLHYISEHNYLPPTDLLESFGV